MHHSGESSESGNAKLDSILRYNHNGVDQVLGKWLQVSAYNNRDEQPSLSLALVFPSSSTVRLQ
eukprot:12109107-Karenia_brevis.AAC.1